MATITCIFGELQVQLLFEGGYYLGCGFYSNKYDMLVYHGTTIFYPYHHYKQGGSLCSPPATPHSVIPSHDYMLLKYCEQGCERVQYKGY